MHVSRSWGEREHKRARHCRYAVDDKNRINRTYLLLFAVIASFSRSFPSKHSTCVLCQANRSLCLSRKNKKLRLTCLSFPCVGANINTNILNLNFPVYFEHTTGIRWVHECCCWCWWFSKNVYLGFVGYISISWAFFPIFFFVLSFSFDSASIYNIGLK